MTSIVDLLLLIVSTCGIGAIFIIIYFLSDKKDEIEIPFHNEVDMADEMNPLAFRAKLKNGKMTKKDLLRIEKKRLKAERKEIEAARIKQLNERLQVKYDSSDDSSSSDQDISEMKSREVPIIIDHTQEHMESLLFYINNNRVSLLFR